MTGLEIRLPNRGLSVRAPRSRSGMLWLAVLLVAGSFLVVQVGRQVYASWAINQQVAQVREQIAATEAQNAELQRELDYLRSPAYISEQARRLQNVGHSGEQVLIIPPGAEEPLPAALRPPVEPPKPMLQQWVDLFFGH